MLPVSVSFQERKSSCTLAVVFRHIGIVIICQAFSTSFPESSLTPWSKREDPGNEVEASYAKFPICSTPDVIFGYRRGRLGRTYTLITLAAQGVTT